MGCVQSGSVDNEARARECIFCLLLVAGNYPSDLFFPAPGNDAIETQIERDALMAKNEIQILLFEAGESGKLALITQMELLHHGGYNNQERESYIEIIFSNIIRYMRAILDDIPDLGLSTSPKNDAYCATIITLPTQTAEISYEVVRAIQNLRQDPAIVEVISRSQELGLHDAAVHYLDAIDRITVPGYLPSDQDIFYSTTTRAGIRETTLKVGELAYRFFDPGQQSRDWRKWIHYFEGVHALIFLANLSDYDQVWCEDKSENDLQATLTIFDSICNSRWLAKTPVILLLNIGIFAEKLLGSPLSDYFPDYRGGNDYDSARDYILRRFVSLNRAAAERPIYAYYVSTADTQQIKFIMSAIQDILLQIHLHRRGSL
ncbi:G protein alpha-subunit [Infundibulicybe gibba]|nr:G protein alpha-subunit [Infundibulicybe gibba]